MPLKTTIISLLALSFSLTAHASKVSIKSNIRGSTTSIYLPLEERDKSSKKIRFKIYKSKTKARAYANAQGATGVLLWTFAPFTAFKLGILGKKEDSSSIYGKDVEMDGVYELTIGPKKTDHSLIEVEIDQNIQKIKYKKEDILLESNDNKALIKLNNILTYKVVKGSWNQYLNDENEIHMRLENTQDNRIAIERTNDLTNKMIGALVPKLLEKEHKNINIIKDNFKFLEKNLSNITAVLSPAGLIVNNGRFKYNMEFEVY